jgi:ABC-type polysaccharide/polyol phosphate export permease
MVTLLLLLFFFLTPIFYDVRSVPAAYRVWYDLNPFVTLLDGYRSAFLHTGVPNLVGLIEVGAISIVLVLAGHALFQRASHQFAEEV